MAEALQATGPTETDEEVLSIIVCDHATIKPLALHLLSFTGHKATCRVHGLERACCLAHPSVSMFQDMLKASGRLAWIEGDSAMSHLESQASVVMQDTVSYRVLCRRLQHFMT